VSKLTSRIFALAAGLAVAGGICSCGGVPGDAAVQIDGTSITKSTLKHWVAIAASPGASGAGTKTAVPVPPDYTACIANLQATETKPAKGQNKKTAAQLKTQCETQYKQLQSEVLGYLIPGQWVIGEAESLGVKATDNEVKKQFNTILKGQYPKESEFQKFLASSGQTVSDLLLRVKIQVLTQKIEKKVTEKASKVTTAQAQTYFNSHRPPEKRNVQIILTKTEAQATSAKKEIESGKSFASVAKKVSIDPTSKASGGLLKEVTRGEEEKALDTAIFSTKPNVLSGPVKTPFGYYVFEVTKTFAAKTFAQEESQIKQQLASTGQQTALSGFATKFRKKWEAKTECAAEYIVVDCKGYKAPKTTSTAAPATSTPTTTTTPATTTKAPKKAPKTSTGAKKK
jgi:foldase protein PrsA